jgi:DNA-binding GntR family transcriptional regulator
MMNWTKSKIYEHLRYRIITQDLRPEQVINEKKLIDLYGIGRTPMREILIDLQKDGLIQRYPRSGTFVAPLDFNQLRHVTEVRRSLEGLVGELAADRITEQRVQMLRDTLERADRLEAEGNDHLEELMQCESEFHMISYDATNNPKLAEILHELQGVCARFWFSITYNQDVMHEQFSDQRQVLDAFERRDKRTAKRVLERHIDKFIASIRSHIFK